MKKHDCDQNIESNMCEPHCRICAEAYEWRYDHEAKAGYLKLSDQPITQTIVLIDGQVMLDKAEDGSVVGVEIII